MMQTSSLNIRKFINILFREDEKLSATIERIWENGKIMAKLLLPNVFRYYFSIGNSLKVRISHLIKVSFYQFHTRDRADNKFSFRQENWEQSVITTFDCCKYGLSFLCHNLQMEVSRGFCRLSKYYSWLLKEVTWNSSD